MNKYLLLTFVGVSLLVSTGCQNTVNTVENTDKTMTPNTINDTRFVTDSFLRDRLKLISVDVAETADGFMRVQLTAKNVRVGVLDQMWSGITGENPYKIKYKFSWLDKNGMALESIFSTWKEITVIPGETVHIQGIASSPNCKDFLINIKEAN